MLFIVAQTLKYLWFIIIQFNNCKESKPNKHVLGGQVTYPFLAMMRSLNLERNKSTSMRYNVSFLKPLNMYILFLFVSFRS